MSQINIHITDENGEVLDSFKMDRDEFVAAQDSALGALDLLSSISIGDE